MSLFKKNKLKQSNLNEFILLLSSSIILNGSKLFIDLSASKLLTISQYGNWALIILIATYMTNLHFGILNGMGREVSIALGEGKNNKAKLYKLAGLKTIIIVTVLIALLFIIMATQNDKGSYYALTLLVFTGLIFYQFVQSVLRAEQKFNKSSYHQALTGILMLVLSIYLMYLFEKVGLVIGFSVSLLFASLYFMKYLNIQVVKVNKKIFSELFNKGFPIYYIGFLYLLFTSIDRVLVQYYLGIEQLAIYHFSNTLFTVGLLFITVLGTQFYPKLLYAYGKTKDVVVVSNMLKNQIKIAITMALILSLIVSLIIYHFIPIFFDEYVESIWPAIILLAGLPGLAVAFILSSFYNVVMMQKRLVPIMILPLLINIMYASWLVQQVHGVIVFAVSSTISFYLYAFYMMWDYRKLTFGH